MDDSERGGLDAIILLVGDLKTTTARALLDMEWVADGLSADEPSALFQLYSLSQTRANAAETLLSMGWIADGVSENEFLALAYLAQLGTHRPSEATVARAMSWISDGVSRIVWLAVRDLNNISHADADAAARLADMPFLHTLEVADMAALNSLGGLDAGQLADILSRPMLKDGVTDDEAPMVSMLARALRTAPDLFDTLLAPDESAVERRTVDLPLAGEVELAIFRARPGARRSMDLLENAVREAESLMGAPLPTRRVRLLFGDVAGSISGINFLIYIAISPEFDADGGGSAARDSPILIAHEVAHYYWWWEAGWINEGMAELMASAIENRRVGTPVGFLNNPCSVARSLKAWEELTPGQRKGSHDCIYSLGERMFVSLLRTLCEDAFWEGARRLYAASPDAGIEEVRQAFGADASDVIDRWYEGN